jgi:hypothetical protein
MDVFATEDNKSLNSIVGAGIGPIHELRARRAQHCEIGAFLVR